MSLKNASRDKKLFALLHNEEERPININWRAFLFDETQEKIFKTIVHCCLVSVKGR